MPEEILTPRTKRMVEIMVRTMAIPSQDQDDATQEAWLGVIDAASRFDGRCQLVAFAQHRVRGRILDWQRAEDPLTRDHRRKVKAGKLPNVSRAELSEAACATRAIQPNQAALVMAREIREAVQRLPEPLRTVVVRTYFEGAEQTEIARDLGLSLTSGRISQMLTRARRMLRQLLELPIAA